jgi:hypothetical protein
MWKILYILPINIVVLDEYTHCTLVISQNTTGMTNLMVKLPPKAKVVKGKAVLLQAWTGPEGSKKLRFLDFMTTAKYGVKVVSLTHRSPLPPGNAPGTHFC